MRAREFVTENMTEPYKQDQIRPDTRAALPHMTKLPNVDNSSPYNGWRFGIAMAGAPHHPMPAEGPTGQKMVVVPFTDEESEIIDAASKMIGIKSTDIASSGSNELGNVNNVSPVAKPRKNKYGV